MQFFQESEIHLFKFWGKKNKILIFKKQNRLDLVSPLAKCHMHDTNDFTTAHLVCLKSAG